MDGVASVQRHGCSVKPPQTVVAIILLTSPQGDHSPVITLYSWGTLYGM